MMFENPENTFFIVLFSLFFLVAFVWIVFARFSMARIEKIMKKNGEERLAPWDGVGARALWYAHAIALPLGKWNLPNDPFFDVLAARKYAKPIDKTLGAVLMVAGYFWVIFAVVGGLLLGL